MPLDLKPLEDAAARQGLPSLRARVVPPDRRRGTWFSWSGGELRVSEHVVDRCPPEDAVALLVSTIVLERHLAGVRLATRAWGAGSLAVAASLALLRPGGLGQPLVWVILGLGLLSAAVLAVSLRARAALRADDETAAQLGDPTPLVRALNAMNQDEVRIGGKRLSARPDLHRRAERLARIHALCAAPRDTDGPA
ncbi:MAG: hypothetical protein ACYTG2_13050 [Planctomycetota bacterium]|jgi:hypothetical protein